MDEIISLPEDTRLILEQFLKEKQEREALELNSTDDIERFEENWVKFNFKMRKFRIIKLFSFSNLVSSGMMIKLKELYQMYAYQ